MPPRKPFPAAILSPAQTSRQLLLADKPIGYKTASGLTGEPVAPTSFSGVQTKVKR